MKTLRWLNKNLSISIPVFLVLGLMVGLLFPVQWLGALIAPLTLLMVYPMMVWLRPKQLLESGHGSVQLWAIMINFLVIPFVAFGLGRLFFADQPELALGLLLTAVLPTSGMTISWTGFAKGNVPVAIKLTIVGLFLGSFLTPFYVYVLLGAELPMRVALVFQQILMFVVIPLVAGQLTRGYLIRRHGQEKFQKQIGPNFPVLSTLGVLGIVFVAMAFQARNLMQSPMLVLYIFVPLLLLYGINYVVSTVVARKAMPRVKLTNRLFPLQP
ncbi:arsenic resistance protein [Orrella sp. 11846]|uniref:arsenic resistance protein n=1 Tax=Orrella sp. 11846 TaxID=3409913 RepID=UPI003B5CE9CC